MNLTLVKENDLAIGKPIPWALYDQHLSLLLGQGSVITDIEHRDKLLELGACHELFLGTQIIANGDNSSEEVLSSVHARADGSRICFTFDDMKLKVENRLQLQPPTQMAHERFLVKVIGFLRGGTLLVTTPILDNGMRMQFVEGEMVVMRSFSGQNAFGFSCTIERVCRLPYEYLHLTFPRVIEGVVVRKSPRVKTRIITAVKNLSMSCTHENSPTFISNISADGAALDAKQALGSVGDHINLAFRVCVHSIEVFLSLEGIILTILNCHATETSEPEIVRHGIEFRGLELNDTVILKSMIYQQIIENPHLQV